LSYSNLLSVVTEAYHIYGGATQKNKFKSLLRLSKS